MGRHTDKHTDEHTDDRDPTIRGYKTFFLLHCLTALSNLEFAGNSDIEGVGQLFLPLSCINLLSFRDKERKNCRSTTALKIAKLCARKNQCCVTRIYRML